MTEYEMPLKCADCPQLRVFQDRIAKHEVLVDELIKMTVSDSVDEVAEATADALKYLASERGISIPDGFNEEEIAAFFRERGSEDIELAQAHIAEVKTQMGAHSAGCFGLVTDSFEKNRRQYDVSICGSPKMVDAPSEVVVVKRTRA